MKKLLVLAAVLVAGVAANAASFRWSASGIYSPTDSTALYSGTASLFCDAISSSAIASATISEGKITASQTTFNDNSFATKFTGATDYDFYFVIETNVSGVDYTYTSSTVTKTAQATSTPTIGFGAQTNTQLAVNSPGAWQSVPEPTSGLLMLLGMAGLALKRKRA